jgi:hypothetical protein
VLPPIVDGTPRRAFPTPIVVIQGLLFSRRRRNYGGIQRPGLATRFSPAIQIIVQPKRRDIAMQPMMGQLKQNGHLVVDNVRGNLEIEVKRDGSENWSGYFVLPAGTQVNNGEAYDLVLTDGRTKKVEINRVNIYPSQTTASFVTPL